MSSKENQSLNKNDLTCDLNSIKPKKEIKCYAVQIKILSNNNIALLSLDGITIFDPKTFEKLLYIKANDDHLDDIYWQGELICLTELYDGKIVTCGEYQIILIYDISNYEKPKIIKYIWAQGEEEDLDIRNDCVESIQKGHKFISGSTCGLQIYNGDKNYDLIKSFKFPTCGLLLLIKS